MPRKTYGPGEREIELLEKMLVVQLHAMGTTQDQIARVVGKQKAWANALLQGADA
jgi:hypothetical protein